MAKSTLICSNELHIQAIQKRKTTRRTTNFHGLNLTQNKHPRKCENDMKLRHEKQ